MTRCYLLSAIMVACVAGCNSELDDFERIELGKPLTRGLAKIPDTQPSSSSASQGSNELTERVNGSVAGWPFPAILGGKVVAIREDSSGKVIAKDYSEWAAGHWGVAQSAVVKWIVEAQVPEEDFKEPLGPDAEEFLAKIARMEQAGKKLSEGMPEHARKNVVSGRRDDEALVYVVRMPINAARTKLEQLRQYKGYTFALVGGDIKEAVDVSGIDMDALMAPHPAFEVESTSSGLFVSAKCGVPLKGHNIVSFLSRPELRPGSSFSLNQSDERAVKFYQSFGMIFFGLAMYTGGRTLWADDYGNYWPALRGITRTGFDVTIEEPGEGEVRIRNIGQRRIRVEYTFFCVLDPLFLAAMIQCSGEEPQIRVKTHTR